MAKKDLEALRLPELQAEFAEVVGKETKSPNKKYLIKKITEALEAGADADDATPVPDIERTVPPTGDAETEGGDEQPKEKLSKLDVPTLQARFHELVGRETKSSNHRYLVHRVREAMKGRIPTGPRRTRDAVPHKVVPIRLPAAAIPDLDEARKRLGLKSRTDLFRIALLSYLDDAGEKDIAALFAAE